MGNAAFSYAATKKPAKVKTPTVSLNGKKAKVTWKKVKNVKIKGKTYKVKYQLRVIGTIKMNNKIFNYKNSFKTAKNSYTITSNKGNKFKFKVRAYYKKGSKTIYGTYSKWTKYKVIPGITSKKVTYKEDYNTIINNNNVIASGKYIDSDNINCFTFSINDASKEYIIKAIDNTPSKIKNFFGRDEEYAVNECLTDKNDTGTKFSVLTSPYTSGIKVNIFDKETGKIVYCDKIDIAGHMFEYDIYSGNEFLTNPFVEKFDEIIDYIYEHSGIVDTDPYNVQLQKMMAFAGNKIYNNNEQYGVEHDICSFYNINMPAIECINGSNNYACMYYLLLGIRGGDNGFYGIEEEFVKIIDSDYSITTLGVPENRLYIYAHFSDDTELICDLRTPNEGNPYWTAKDPNNSQEDAIWRYDCATRNYEALYNYTPWRNWIKQIIPNWSEWFNFH